MSIARNDRIKKRKRLFVEDLLDEPPLKKRKLPSLTFENIKNALEEVRSLPEDKAKTYLKLFTALALHLDKDSEALRANIKGKFTRHKAIFLKIKELNDFLKVINNKRMFLVIDYLYKNNWFHVLAILFYSKKFPPGKVGATVASFLEKAIEKDRKNISSKKEMDEITVKPVDSLVESIKDELKKLKLEEKKTVLNEAPNEVLINKENLLLKENDDPTNNHEEQINNNVSEKIKKSNVSGKFFYFDIPSTLFKNFFKKPDQVEQNQKSLNDKELDLPLSWYSSINNKSDF